MPKHNSFCDECMKIFSSPQKLNRHAREQHIENQITLACVQCGMSFKRKEGLDRHIRALHLDTKYLCLCCPRRFGEKCKLKNHYKTEHDVAYFSCCEKVDFPKISLRKNQEHVCAKSSFICHFDNCGRIFRREGYLYKHLFTVHSNEENRKENLKVQEINKNRFSNKEQTIFEKTEMEITVKEFSGLAGKNKGNPGFFDFNFFKPGFYELKKEKLVETKKLAGKKKIFKKEKIERPWWICKEKGCLKLFPTLGRMKSHFSRHVSLPVTF